MFYNVSLGPPIMYSVGFPANATPASVLVVVTGFKRLTIDIHAENMYRPIGG